MIPKQYPGRVTRKTKALRLLWVIVSCLLFRPFPTRLFWPWRRLLLCAFGARVHREANVYSSSNILRTQRVAWHQNYVSEIAHFCINVWGSHCFILFVT